MYQYLINRIGGNLLSALASDADGVGASTAIFGLVGCIASFYIMNWKTLDIVGSMMKCCFCCLFFMFIFFLIFFSLSVNFLLDTLSRLLDDEYRHSWTYRRTFHRPIYRILPNAFIKTA